MQNNPNAQIPNNQGVQPVAQPATEQVAPTQAQNQPDINSAPEVSQQSTAAPPVAQAQNEPQAAPQPAQAPTLNQAGQQQAAPGQEKKVSFFGKIKQWLGIGGVKIEVEVDPNITWSTTEIKGAMNLVSKSEQQITNAKVEMEEIVKYKSGDSYSTKTYSMGPIYIPAEMIIKAGEQKRIDFVLPIHFVKSANEKLQAQGGVLGALGKAGRFMAGRSSTYDLTASIDVKGTGLDPSKRVHMKLVQ